MAEALVSKGLATVVKYRPDDDQRSSRYDDLLAAETKAAKSQLGLHSKKDYPPLRVTEIVSNLIVIVGNHLLFDYAISGCCPCKIRIIFLSKSATNRRTC